SGFGVQLSTAFIGMAMPPTVGHVAVNARYLHRQDVDEGTIAAAVTMSQVVNVVTTVLLLIVFGLLTGSGLSRFKIAPGTDLLIGLAAIAGVIIIPVAVPPDPWARGVGLHVEGRKSVFGSCQPSFSAGGDVPGAELRWVVTRCVSLMRSPGRWLPSCWHGRTCWRRNR